MLCAPALAVLRLLLHPQAAEVLAGRPARLVLLLDRGLEARRSPEVLPARRVVGSILLLRALREPAARSGPVASQAMPRWRR